MFAYIAADIAEPEVISLPGSGSYEVFWPDRLPGTRQVALAYINISQYFRSNVGPS